MEADDAIVHAMKHPLHLVVASPSYCEAAAVGVEDFEFGREGGDVLGVKIETVGEGLDRGLIDRIDRLDEVGFRTLESLLSDALGPAAIVGEQGEAGGGAVEATGDVKGVLVGVVDQIDDGLVLGIGGGTDDSGGFVEHEVERADSGLDHVGVEQDLREAIHFMGGIRDRLMVDGDSSRRDGSQGARSTQRPMFGDEPDEFHLEYSEMRH